ncbi:ArsR/SmtB family transcription factor [Micrococcoides hystricis]|uniref:ArsR/SmtB family transcription factor n=1 Tax=Micrococcoides hystricis TaxID=1572761 RepID=A0ABV6P859_9MICC
MQPDFSQFEEPAELFKKLASPVRLALINELAKGERCVHELVDELLLAQPLVSQHLRILRDARIVKSGRRGREMVYQLADDHITTILRDGLLHSQERVHHQDPETETELDVDCEREQAG